MSSLSAMLFVLHKLALTPVLFLLGPSVLGTQFGASYTILVSNFGARFQFCVYEGSGLPSALCLLSRMDTTRGRGSSSRWLCPDILNPDVSTHLIEVHKVWDPVEPCFVTSSACAALSLSNHSYLLNIYSR